MFARLIILVSLIIITCLPVTGQSRSGRKKQQQAERKQEKQKELDDKWFEEYTEQNRKRHWNNQTREVQKRMKIRKKSANRFNKQNHSSIFEKIINNRKRKKRYGKP